MNTKTVTAYHSRDRLLLFFQANAYLGISVGIKGEKYPDLNGKERQQAAHRLNDQDGHAGGHRLRRLLPILNCILWWKTSIFLPLLL